MGAACASKGEGWVFRRLLLRNFIQKSNNRTETTTTRAAMVTPAMPPELRPLEPEDAGADAKVGEAADAVSGDCEPVGVGGAPAEKEEALALCASGDDVNFGGQIRQKKNHQPRSAARGSKVSLV
jgi:hypothetical protein